MIDLLVLEQFYFEVKGQSWAAGSQYQPIPNMPDHKEFRFQKDDFFLIDQYFTTPYSSESNGSTFIYYQGHIAWYMNYWGFYAKKAIPFLKQTLLYQYNKQEFLGGRGPKFYLSDNYLYLNITKGNFAEAEGREEIYDRLPPVTFMGYHKYRCKLTIS